MVTPIEQRRVGTEVTFTFVGKSEDEKPEASNGSKFIEMDTGKEFFFDGDEQGWTEQADKYLASIEITNPPLKTVYFEGNEFEADGIAVQAVYTDDSTAAVTDIEIECNNPLQLGDDHVVVKYKENGRTRTAEQPITVKDYIAEDKAEFLEAIANADHVQLGADIVLPSIVNLTKDFNLDLNGHKLSTTKASGYLLNADGATLTITGDGEIEARRRIGVATNGGIIVIENGKFSSEVDVAFCALNGKVVFNDGEIIAREGGIIAPEGNGEIEVNGGHIAVSDNFAISSNGNAYPEGVLPSIITINDGLLEGNIVSDGYEAIGVYLPNNDTFVMNGGKIIAHGGAGICMRGGNVTINGGEIIAEGDENTKGWIGDLKGEVGVMSCSGIIYHIYPDYSGGKIGMHLEVNGGKITGVAHAIDVVSTEEHPNVDIHGGTFQPAFPEAV